MRKRRVVFSAVLLFVVFIAGNVLADWVKTKGPGGQNVHTLCANGMYLYAGTEGAGVFRSSNNGMTWTTINNGITNDSVWAIAVKDGYLFAGTLFGGIFRSADSGASWAAVNNGWTYDGFPYLHDYTLAVSGNNLFAGTGGGGLFLSTNNGASWSQISTGLQNLSINAMTVNGSTLFAGSNFNYSLHGAPVWVGGVFRTTDTGVSWTRVNNDMMIGDNVLAVHGGTVFAGVTDYGVLRSVDNGISWSQVNNGITSANMNVHALAVRGSIVCASVGASGVWISTNDGASWTAVNTGLTTLSIQTFAVDDNYLYAAIADTVWRRPLAEMTQVRLSLNMQTQGNVSVRIDNNILRYTLLNENDISFSLFDIHGRTVVEIVKGKQSAGEYSFILPSERFPAGNYLLVFNAGEYKVYKRFPIIH